MKKLWEMDNTKKLAIVTFFSNLYFYNHIGTLYQQTRGLSLLQVSSIWSIIVGTIFLAEVPTGILADKIGRKWSVVTALLLQTLGEFLYFFAVFIYITEHSGELVRQIPSESQEICPCLVSVYGCINRISYYLSSENCFYAFMIANDSIVRWCGFLT